MPASRLWMITGRPSLEARSSWSIKSSIWALAVAEFVEVVEADLADGYNAGSLTVLDSPMPVLA